MGVRYGRDTLAASRSTIGPTVIRHLKCLTGRSCRANEDNYFRNSYVGLSEHGILIAFHEVVAWISFDQVDMLNQNDRRS